MRLRTHLHLLALSSLGLIACSSESKPTPAPEVAPVPTKAEATKASDAGMGTTGRHRAQEGEDWVPAEFKEGRAKWKDAGVYVDGVPVAMLFFGELPQGMTPVWKDASEQGDPELQRFRFVEYFDRIGIDVARIKEVHIYGGGLHVMRISGSDVRKYAKDFHFRFGRGTRGKPLIMAPADMPKNTLFDKISGVAVYIDKKPPVVDDDQNTVMDGKVIWDVPYFGAPLRGGVRVYRDDRLALHLKRNKLEESQDLAEWNGDKTELRWKLLPFLAHNGVKVDDLVWAETVQRDKREVRLDRKALESMYFTAAPQSSGRIRLGDDKVEVSALALYTSAIPNEDPSAPPGPLAGSKDPSR